jgi:asparagine synthase (glutamine-hydrolysing)
MCGLAGYWNLNHRSLPDLRPKMAKRGPDSDGIFFDKNVTLFHSRLSIIDLSSGGAQPMKHESGIVIIFNGEIYNFKELKSKLLIKGYSFKSTSDTEVLLCLYRDMGMKFLNLLVGMFAVAIYDYRSGQDSAKLFLARDQFGIKPLLYSEIEKGVIFGSEIKILLASGLIPPEVDLDALRELFAVGCVYQPKTLIKEIKSVQSGCYLEVNSEGLSKNVRWAENSSENEYKLVNGSILDTAEFVINQSIEKHLISDVPVSCLLSGGLDSSLIAAMIKRNYDVSLNTYTLGFKGLSKPSEANYGQNIADYLGTGHHNLDIDFDKIEEDLYNFVLAIDQPSMDGFNTFLVCKEVAKFSKVLISGTGGDEMFAGYPWFDAAVRKKEFRSLNYVSRTVRKNSRYFAKYKNLFEAIAFLGPLGSFSAGLKAFGYSGADLLLKLPNNTKITFSNSQLDFESRDFPEIYNSVSRLSNFCLQGYTKNQLLRDIDATSMFFSLEVRTPLISQEVYKFAQQIPDNWKLGPRDSRSMAGSYQNTGEKYVLQHLAKKYLPDSLLQRKKQGFEVPLDELLRGPLFRISQSKFEIGNLDKIPFLNAKEISRLYKGFKENKVPAIHVWLILIFILWYESLSFELNND